MATTTWEYGTLFDEGVSYGKKDGSLNFSSNSSFQTKLNEIPPNVEITLVKLYATLYSTSASGTYVIKLNNEEIASGGGSLTENLTSSISLEKDITSYAESETQNAGNISGDLYVSINTGSFPSIPGTKVCKDIKIVWTYTLPNHTITAIPNNSSYGTVTGGGTYEERQVITLTATPNTGYQFSKWSDGNTSATRQVTVGTSNATYTAIFTRLNRVFSISSNEFGKVKVSYINTIFNENQEFSLTRGATYNIPDGSTVTLTAYPNDTNICEFQWWSDYNTSPSRTISLNSNVNYIASFVPKADGTISPPSRSICSFYQNGVEKGGATKAGLTAFINNTASLTIGADSSASSIGIVLFDLFGTTITTESRLPSGIYNVPISGKTIYFTGLNSMSIDLQYALETDGVFAIRCGTNIEPNGVSNKGTYLLHDSANTSTVGSFSTTLAKNSSQLNNINQNLNIFLENDSLFDAVWGVTLHASKVTLSKLLVVPVLNYVNKYTVNRTVNNINYGTVKTTNYQAVETTSSSFFKGQELTLEAIPQDGCRFVKWSDGVTDSSRTITVSKNITYTAQFERINDVYVGTEQSNSVWIGTNEVDSVWIGSSIVVYGHS